MALAFDPNRTFYTCFMPLRHKTSIQTNTYPFIEKERGKGLREGSRKKRENYKQSKFLFQKYEILIAVILYCRDNP